jgi:DNA-binding NtrC family response regulator
MEREQAMGSFICTLLLVEDDELYGVARERRLELAGFDVIAVADTNAALDAADRRATIDASVTDIQMPSGGPHGVALAQMLEHPNVIPFPATQRQPHADWAAAVMLLTLASALLAVVSSIL